MMFKKLRRKLARMIWVDEVPQTVVPIRNYRHKMVDEVDREYEEYTAGHRAEAERIRRNRGHLKCLN